MSIVTIVAALGTLAFSAHVENWYFPGYMFPILWLFGVASMLWSYMVSLYSRSELQAFGLTVCLMVVSYVLSIVGFSVCCVPFLPRALEEDTNAANLRSWLQLTQTLVTRISSSMPFLTHLDSYFRS